MVWIWAQGERFGVVVGRIGLCFGHVLGFQVEMVGGGGARESSGTSALEFELVAKWQVC